MAVASLTTLYHVSTPMRTPWLRDMPGAVLTLVIWALASFVLRGTISASLGGTSIYGPLSAPIVLLIWLYFLAIAVLIGAALNAAIRVMWPVEERPSARVRAVGWVKSEMRRRQAPEPGVSQGVEPGVSQGVEPGVSQGVEPGAGPEPAAGRSAATGGGSVSGGARAAEGSKAARPLTPMPEGAEEESRKTARSAS
jgi:membrane protein